MALSLDKFRDVDLVIDKANDNFIQRQFVSQADYKGRTLTVQVTNNGEIGEIPGLFLNLRWQNQVSGLTDLTAFVLIDKENNVFRIEYPKHMMTPGKVIASIQLIHDGKTLHMKQFELTVQKLAGEAVGIVEKAEYSALVAVLSDANKFRTDIDVLGVNKVDKNGNGQVTWGMLNQDVKEKMVDDAVPIVDIEAVNTPNVIDQAITPEKTNFMTKKVKSFNYFDVSQVISGYYVNYQTGKLTASSDYFASGFIRIPDWAIKVARSNAEQCAFYDDNFNFLAGEATAATNSYFAIWQTAKYIRFSLKNAQLTNFQVAFLNDKQSAVMPSYTKFEAEYLVKDQDTLADVVDKIVISNNYYEKSDGIAGYYIDFNNGFPRSNANYYMTDYIDVPDWAIKCVKNNAEQCAFYSDFNEYLGGNSTALTNKFFDIPKGTKKMRFSIRTEQVDTFFVSFIKKDQPEIVPAYDQKKVKYVLKSDEETVTKNTVTIPEDFSTLASASNYVNNLEERKTIEVSPGEYTEVLVLKGNQYVDMTSINKRTTLIKDTSGAYENSPLTISGEGYFKNLTFLATNSGTLPQKTSYAAHIDYEGEGTLVFEDCDFVSYQNSAVGIGTHMNQTIIFRRCRFVNNTIPEKDGGALYMHNNVNDSVVKQRIIFENCYMYSETGLFLRVDDANAMNSGNGNDCEITFINNYLFSEMKGLAGISLRAGSTQTGDGCLIGNIKLSKMSHGNNIDVLNAY